MKVYADARVIDTGHKATVDASSLALRVGAFPTTVEYRSRSYSHPWRMVSNFGELEAIRYRTDDSLYTFTIWND